MRNRKTINIICGIIILLISVHTSIALPNLLDVPINYTFGLIDWGVYYNFFLTSLNVSQRNMKDPIIDVNRLDAEFRMIHNILTGKEIDANNILQNGIPITMHEEHVKRINEKIDIIWGYILVILNIVLEMIKIFFILIRFYIIVWIFAVGIPYIFIKMRDNLSKYYISTRGRRQ